MGKQDIRVEVQQMVFQHHVILTFFNILGVTSLYAEVNAKADPIRQVYKSLKYIFEELQLNIKTR